MNPNSNPILVTSTGESTGKTAVALALALAAKEDGRDVGFMKPKGTRLQSSVGKTLDEDPMLARELLDLDAAMHEMEPVVYSPTFVQEVVRGREDAASLRETVREAYEGLAAEHDLMVVEGGGWSRPDDEVGLAVAWTRFGRAGTPVGMGRYVKLAPMPDSGTLVAEAHFGEVNPGGKLPITFPKTVGQIQQNFPYKRGSQADVSEWVGVTTRVSGNLYPFGHGLSYTTFAYDNLQVTPEQTPGAGSVTVTFDVTNTGDRAGDAVPQVYVRDVTASVTTYDSQLRGFERVALEPGETETVTVELGPEHLMLLDREMHWAVEASMFEVLVGSSTEDIYLRGQFEVTETATFGKPPVDH